MGFTAVEKFSLFSLTKIGQRYVRFGLRKHLDRAMQKGDFDFQSGFMIVGIMKILNCFEVVRKMSARVSKKENERGIKN